MTFKELLNENILSECPVWYFDFDETKKQITVIFEIPSYRSALFFRMIVFKNVEYFKFLGKLYKKQITCDFFISRIKEMKVEIEFADILKKFNERYSLKLYLGSYAMQFDCDKTILHERRAFWPTGNGMCKFNEIGEEVSIKWLSGAVQTKEFCDLFL